MADSRQRLGVRYPVVDRGAWWGWEWEGRVHAVTGGSGVESESSEAAAGETMPVRGEFLSDGEGREDSAAAFPHLPSPASPSLILRHSSSSTLRGSYGFLILVGMVWGTWGSSRTRYRWRRSSAAKRESRYASERRVHTKRGYLPVKFHHQHGNFTLPLCTNVIQLSLPGFDLTCTNTKFPEKTFLALRLLALSSCR